MRSDFRINAFISLVCIILYCLNKTTTYNEIEENILKYIWDYNFTDFLCVILNLSLANTALALLKKKGVYDFRTIIVLSVFSCFLWEFVITLIKSESTFDIFDCMAYLLGGTFYYCLMKTVHNTSNLQK